jgi:hypothetical protein
MFVMDEEKLIILVQGRESLYNLQHKHYDNNLVKGNCWKEIAGEWQGRGRVAAWERHVMCESAFKGNGKATPLQDLTGPEGSRRLRLPDFKTIGT